MSHEFTRAQLYQLVWSKPMTEVAASLGVSDVAVAKACRRLAVPRPGVGYWQELRAGKGGVKPKLGRAHADAPQTVTIGGNKVVKPPTVTGAQERASESENRPENRIQVRQTLRNCSKVVSEAIAFMADAYQSDGVLHPRKNNPCLALRVSKNNLNRALRIYDALIRGAEARGWSVVVKADSYPTTTAFVLGKENLHVKPEELTQKVAVPQKPGSSWHYPTHEFKPTGTLRLRLEHHLNGLPKGIADSKTNPLEERLNEVMIAFAGIEQGLELQRIEREEWHRQYQDELRREEELRQYRHRMAKRREVLPSVVKAWRISAETKRFLEALRVHLAERVAEPQWTAFLDWAEEHVETTNPLSKLNAGAGPAALDAMFVDFSEEVAHNAAHYQREADKGRT